MCVFSQLFSSSEYVIAFMANWNRGQSSTKDQVMLEDVAPTGAYAPNVDGISCETESGALPE